MNQFLKKIIVVTLVAFAFVFLLSIITPKVSATEMTLNSALDIQSNSNNVLFDEVYLYLDSLDNYDEYVIDYIYSSQDVVLHNQEQFRLKRMAELIKQNKVSVDLKVLDSKPTGNEYKYNKYKLETLVSYKSNFSEEVRTVTEYIVVIPKNSDVIEDNYSYFFSSSNFTNINSDLEGTFFSTGILFKDLIRNNLNNGTIKKNTEYIVYGKFVITDEDGTIQEVVRTNGYNVIFTNNENNRISEKNANPGHNLNGWYFAHYGEIGFSNDSKGLVSAQKEGLITIEDKPIYLNFSYEAKLPSAIKELQSMIVVMAIDGSDFAVFYPTLNKDNVVCKENLNVDTKLRDCNFEYQIPIYRSFKKGVEYRVGYSIFPATDKQVISQEEVNSAEDELVRYGGIKVYFGNTPYNGRIDMYNKHMEKNYNLFKNLNPEYNSKVVIIDDISSTANSVNNNSSNIKPGTFSSQNRANVRVVVDADVTQLSSDMINLKKRYAKSTVLPINQSKLTVVDSKDNSKDVYIQKENQTRKLKDISEVLREERISVDNISSDISIVEVDGRTSYVFRTTEKRRLFGIIPIGNKNVYNVLNAVEDIK